jgi:hypothetical protein
VQEYFDAAGPLAGVSWPVRYKQDDAERLEHLRSMDVRMFSALAYARLLRLGKISKRLQAKSRRSAAPMRQMQ